MDSILASLLVLCLGNSITAGAAATNPLQWINASNNPNCNKFTLSGCTAKDEPFQPVHSDYSLEDCYNECNKMYEETCKFFIFKDKQCELYGFDLEDYYASCKFSGGPLKTLRQACKLNEEPCKDYLHLDCKGFEEEEQPKQYPSQTEMECYMQCTTDNKEDNEYCKYFIFDHMEKKCSLYSTDRISSCEALVVPQTAKEPNPNDHCDPYF